MTNNTKTAQAIRLADEKGYHCDYRGNIYNPEGNALEGCINNGYKAFSVTLDKSVVKVRFHQFIAFQRYGDQALTEGIVVRHWNNNKMDNSWNNLLLGSHSENYMDLPKQVRIDRARHAGSALKAA